LRDAIWDQAVERAVTAAKDMKRVTPRPAKSVPP
jgi:hypothetical protein